MNEARRLTIELTVRGSGDNELQPYIDRWLKIWLARGAGANGGAYQTMTELVPADAFCCCPVTIEGVITHEYVP
jgi:hypothetical protein